MSKSEAYDVVYHKYPSQRFDDDAEAAKPVPIAVAVPEGPYSTPTPLTPISSPSKPMSPFLRIPALLLFYTAEAVLGIGGAIIVLVCFPLSIGFLPLGCIGAVMFQILAHVVRWFAKIDIWMANMISTDGKHMHTAFGIQSGFSTSNGRRGIAARLFFVSPKTLLVMLYFATIKLAVGCVGAIIVHFVVAIPIEIAATNGGHFMFGDGFTYDNHPTAYVLTFVGLWVLGAALIPIAWRVSVKLTRCFCAEREGEAHAQAQLSPVRAMAVGTIETPPLDSGKGF